MSRILGSGPMAGADGRSASVARFAGQVRQAGRDQALSPATPAPGADPATGEAAHRLLLENEVARLTAELEGNAARAEALQQQAHARGLAEGSRKSAEDAAARERLLGQALEAAVTAFAARQDQLEYLAVQVAGAAVARILGPDGAHDDLLARTVRHQVARFAADKPVALRLSRHDFPDPASAAAIAEQVPGVRLVIDPALGAGSCVLALELGEREIGLPGQLGEVRAYFERLALERETTAPQRHPVGGKA